MNVPIAGVAEAGDRESVFLPQFRRELGEVDQAAARNGDVLVQLRQPGRFE